MTRKILITGAGGFIGGFIVEEAIRRGYKTWAGIRNTTSREYLTDPEIQYIDLPFGNKQQLTQLLQRLKEKQGRWDYIIHNLGITKCKNPDDFYTINYGYVKNFAEALISSDMVPTQFILMSSLGSWGAGDEQLFTPIYPTDTPKPETKYGASKLKAEQALKNIPDFPYVIFRPTGVYGPREKDYYLMMKCIKFGFDFIAGYKKQLITFIYVKDLVKAIFLSIDKGVTRKSYFISDGKAYTSSQFRHYIASALGKKIVIPIRLPLIMLKTISYSAELGATLFNKTSTLNRDKFRIMKQRNWICDISQIQEELGFSPDYDLRQGVNETIAWYKKEKWL